MFAMQAATVVLSLFYLTLLPFTRAAESCQGRHNVTSLQVAKIQDYFGSDDKIDLQLVGNKANPQEQRILGECKQKIDDISSLDKCDYAYLMLQCLFLGKVSRANTS